MHRSRSLGQAIASVTLPFEDGHYNALSGEFTAHDFNDQNEVLFSSIQSNNSDTAYIFSSQVNAKYTSKHFVSENYNVQACAVQRVLKHLSTAQNILSRKNLVRYDGIDYSGELIAFPTSYNHALINRNYHDTAPDDTELTREKLNEMEFGIQLEEG
jgi:hypothetical protein